MVLLSFLSHAQLFVVGVAGALVVSYVCYTLITWKTTSKHLYRPKQQLPQPPTTLPIVGNLFDLLQKSSVFHDWLFELCVRFDGKPFALTSPGRNPLIVISSPEGLEEIVTTHVDTFVKGPHMYERFHDFLGDALTIVDGDAWKFQRKTLVTLFSARALRESMAEIIQKNTRILVDFFQQQQMKGKSQQPFDLSAKMHRFTMTVFTEIGFGLQLGSLESTDTHEFERAFDAAQRIIVDRFAQPTIIWKLKRWLNVGKEAELKRSIKVIDNVVLDVISKALAKRANYETKTQRSGNDIVSLAIESAEANEHLNPQVLRSLVVAALVAGRDTTAQTFCWFIYLLNLHPEVETKVRKELRVKLPAAHNAAKSLHLSMDVLQELIYTEAALKETLRLYPAGALNGKYCNQDTVLRDGTFIPKGTSVMLPHYAMGRMSSIWGPDSLEFKPERWIDDTTGKLRQFSPYKFSAFFAGPRICVGRHLAMLELKMLVVNLLTRFHIAVEVGQDVTYDRSISLPMKHPFMVKIEAIA